LFREGNAQIVEPEMRHGVIMFKGGGNKILYGIFSENYSEGLRKKHEQPQDKF
jgi:hypothetical protein